MDALFIVAVLFHFGGQELGIPPHHRPIPAKDLRIPEALPIAVRNDCMERAFGLDGIVFSNAVTTVISTAIALLLCRRRSRQVSRAPDFA